MLKKELQEFKAECGAKNMERQIIIPSANSLGLKGRKEREMRENRESRSQVVALENIGS